MRVSRQELYNEVFVNSRLTKVFLVMVALSTVVAAVGLIRNNVAVIIGAMVAAALVPPLVTSGMLVGSGYFTKGVDSFLLVLVNMICINLAGVVTYLFQGIRFKTGGRRIKQKKRQSRR